MDAPCCCILLDVGLWGRYSTLSKHVMHDVIMRQQTHSESPSSVQSHVLHSLSRIEEYMTWCQMLAGYPSEQIGSSTSLSLSVLLQVMQLQACMAFLSLGQRNYRASVCNIHIRMLSF